MAAVKPKTKVDEQDALEKVKYPKQAWDTVLRAQAPGILARPVAVLHAWYMSQSGEPTGAYLRQMGKALTMHLTRTCSKVPHNSLQDADEVCIHISI
jgi:hypothetical protein